MCRVNRAATQQRQQRIADALGGEPRFVVHLSPGEYDDRPASRAEPGSAFPVATTPLLRGMPVPAVVLRGETVLRNGEVQPGPHHAVLVNLDLRLRSG